MRAVFEATLQKEISAGMVARYINMNYTSWLGDLNLMNQTIPLYEDLPPSPSVAGVIRTMFGQARSRLEGSKIYPVLRTKTIGRDATRINSNLTDENLMSGEDVPQNISTMLDVERFYYKTGDHPQGCTELRSAWRLGYNCIRV
jgi:hypothetical protein